MKKLLKELYWAGVKAVNPEKLVKKNIKLFLKFYKKQNRKKIIIISIGKASFKMAMAGAKELKENFYMGIIITKYGHIDKNLLKNKTLEKFKIFEAGHPLPDENGLKATKEVLKIIEKEKKDSIFLILISGGSSSLFIAPSDGISLKDKIKTTEILLKAGAGIGDLNCVRKHLSKVKGGNLAKLTYPAPSVSFIISDVISDKLDVIGSGPTSPDKTTFKDALKVLDKFKVKDRIPKTVLKLLKDGALGKIEENPKEKNDIFKKNKNYIIGRNEIALKEIKRKAKEMGLNAKIVSCEIEGEARVIGKKLLEFAIFEKEKLKTKKGKILIFGGETTVNVKGKGKGGRAQELALSFAINIKGKEGIYLLSAGTDGTDGPTDAAGAIVCYNTIKKAEKIKINPLKYLNENNSYNFFKKVKDLFITAPTGTNVMDLYLILIINKGFQSE